MRLIFVELLFEENDGDFYKFLRMVWPSRLSLTIRALLPSLNI